MLYSWRPDSTSQQKLTRWALRYQCCVVPTRQLPAIQPAQQPAAASRLTPQCHPDFETLPDAVVKLRTKLLLLLPVYQPYTTRVIHFWILHTCKALKMLPCLQVAPIGLNSVPAHGSSCCPCTAATVATANQAPCLLCMLPVKAVIAASVRLHMQLSARPLTDVSFCLCLQAAPTGDTGPVICQCQGQSAQGGDRCTPPRQLPGQPGAPPHV